MNPPNTTNDVFRMSILVFILCVNVSITQAQDVRSPAEQFEVEEDFRAFLEQRHEGFEAFEDLNFGGSATVSAIPLLESPVNAFSELIDQSTVIGSVYFSTGSLRLKLPPGAYQLLLFGGPKQWKVQFVTADGTIKNVVPAQVSESEAVEKPLTSVEHSVCYRFNSTVVCV